MPQTLEDIPTPEEVPEQPYTTLSDLYEGDKDEFFFQAVFVKCYGSPSIEFSKYLDIIRDKEGAAEAKKFKRRVLQFKRELLNDN